MTSWLLSNIDGHGTGSLDLAEGRRRSLECELARSTVGAGPRVRSASSSTLDSRIAIERIRTRLATPGPYAASL